jgi:hypothetical protein
LLRLFCPLTVAVHRFARPHFENLIIHLQFVPNPELRSFEFLLVFFVSQVGISFLGEVNQFGDMVDNLRSRGAKIAGIGSFDLKPDRCVALHQNESYHHLTEDWESRPHQVVFRAKVHRQVHIYSLVLSVSHCPIVLCHTRCSCPRTFHAIALHISVSESIVLSLCPRRGLVAG